METIEMDLPSKRSAGSYRRPPIRGETDTAPIGIMFTLAVDSPCKRVAPPVNRHPVWRHVESDQ
jgi:hypothetical protein